MKMIKVFLINERGAREIVINNDYRAFNKVLGWSDAWNTPTIKIKGKSFICVCSDTGKLRGEKISCLGYNNLFSDSEFYQEPFIVGNCIITKFDGVDDFESLTEEDIKLLSSYLLDTKNQVSNAMPKILILDY